MDESEETAGDSTLSDQTESAFPQPPLLVSHITAPPAGRNKSYKCCLCDRSFPSLSLLCSQHYPTHLRQKTDESETTAGDSTLSCHQSEETFSNITPTVAKTFHRECGEIFESHEDLSKHKLIHREKTYSCSLCHQSFTSLSLLLYNHYPTHLPKKTYKCDQCWREFTHPDVLQIHKRLHTRGKPYSCDRCGKSYPTQDNLNYHMKSVHGEKTLLCYICGETFAMLRQIRNHEASHAKEKPCRCDQCGKIFLTSRKPGVKTLRCTQCVKSSKFLQSLSKHYREKPFKCDECEKRFVRARDVKSHMKKVHSNSSHQRTGQKPLQCNVCAKLFLQASRLRQHEAGHEAERPYECDQCGQTFRTKTYLPLHKLQHSKKLYKCKRCDRSFRYFKHLCRHYRTHTGKTRHKCELCANGSKSQSHMRVHTGEEQSGPGSISSM